MTLSVQPIFAFEDNIIWCIHDDGGPSCVIVDPGDAQPVLAFLDKEQLNLEAILITHHHADHMGGVDALVAHAPHTKVYGPTTAVCASQTHRCKARDTIDCLDGQFSCEVIATPGHTLDHIAFVGSGLLFCGDTLFAGGCGRLFEGTPKQMLTSLEALRALPDETEVYCAHEYTLNNLAFALTVEPDNATLQKRHETVKALRAKDAITLPSTIGLEKQTNPFLRCDQQTLQDHLGCNTTLATFTQCRLLKDRF